jgi:outer membrane protein assembly factor BamB
MRLHRLLPTSWFACVVVLGAIVVDSTALSFSAWAQDPPQWSQFRGPNGAGSVENCKVNLPWQPSDVKWTLSLPGNGNASPVIWNNTAYLVSADRSKKERYLHAIDIRTSKELWQKKYSLTETKLHPKNNFASGSPCVDASAIYFAYADPERVVLTALSHKGEPLWEREFGSFVSQHGFGSSPVVHQGTVVFWVSQDAEQLPPNTPPGDSRIIGLDAKSGQQKWSTSRIATRTCYGTPTLYQAESGPALLFANTAEGVFALDLATGKPLWNRQSLTQRSVSSPIVVGNLAIATEGSGAGNNVLVAINTTGEHEQVFSKNKNMPYVPTPVVKGDLLFLWSDKGIVSCLRLSDNEMIWSERIGTGGSVSTSPIIAGDKLVGIAEDGTLTVLSATEEFQNFGSISLGETTRATPAVAENYLLVRTDTKLICIGNP